MTAGTGNIRLAVVGSRTFDDYGMLCQSIESNFNLEDIGCIVSGGAKGADSLGARFAAEHGIELAEFRPDWKKYGRSAGFVRNREIIDACTHCIAFWDGQSRGTAHDIELCSRSGKPCIIVRFEPQDK